MTHDTFAHVKAGGFGVHADGCDECISPRLKEFRRANATFVDWAAAIGLKLDVSIHEDDDEDTERGRYAVVEIEKEDDEFVSHEQHYIDIELLEQQQAPLIDDKVRVLWGSLLQYPQIEAVFRAGAIIEANREHRAAVITFLDGPATPHVITVQTDDDGWPPRVYRVPVSGPAAWVTVDDQLDSKLDVIDYRRDHLNLHTGTWEYTCSSS